MLLPESWFVEMTSCTLCGYHNYNQHHIWFPSVKDTELLPVCTACLQAWQQRSAPATQAGIIEVDL
jgi:hypothetical protein